MSQFENTKRPKFKINSQNENYVVARGFYIFNLC